MCINLYIMFFISLWVSCLNCKRFSSHLCCLLLSRCWPTREGGATNVSQSNFRGILGAKSSRYRSSKIVGKFRGKVVVGVWFVVERVEGGERISGTDREVSDDRSLGSFSKLGPPWVNTCVIQCGRRCFGGGLKGFQEFVGKLVLILNSRMVYVGFFLLWSRV